MFTALQRIRGFVQKCGGWTKVQVITYAISSDKAVPPRKCRTHLLGNNSSGSRCALHTRVPGISLVCNTPRMRRHTTSKPAQHKLHGKHVNDHSEGSV
eukprot:3600482-Rhodomonas_salina.1